MALSNMFNEPVREITETVVGVAVVGGYLTGAYFLADWIVPSHFHDRAVAVVELTALSIPVGGLCLLLAALAHALGDVICNGLGRFDPRPRNRPNGRE